MSKKKKGEFCLWTYDDDGHYDFHATDCGKMFSFEADGVQENKFQFCPYCGRRIKEKANPVD